MEYPGKELENFDKAKIWRNYIYFEIKKFIRGKVLEVGAGIGSFTENYMHLTEKLTLSEIDSSHYPIYHSQRLCCFDWQKSTNRIQI